MAQIAGLAVLLLIAAIALVALLTGLLVREARRPPRHTAGWALARGLACDPADLGLTFQSWWLDRPGGVRLPVWEIDLSEEAGEKKNAAGSGPLTALFIHGWGQSRIDMLRRLDPWPALCDRIVMYDLRGHGDATGGKSMLGGDVEVDDLRALLDELGEGPCVLVGFSMGAVIAMHALTCAAGAGETNRFAGLVAYGPYIGFHRSLRGRLAVSGLPARPMTDLAMLIFKACGIHHRPTIDAAEALPCPLLVIHGAQDEVAPPSHGRRLAEAAGDGALHLVEEAAHLNVQFVASDGHDAAVRAFVARAAGRGA